MHWNGRSLVFRVDAGPEIGVGHLMRCLSLAQAAEKEGAQSVFVMAGDVRFLSAPLKPEGFEIVRLSVTPGGPEDANQTTTLAKEKNAEWLVVDGYSFEPAYLRRVKGCGFSLLVIDDQGYVENCNADFVVNQNIDATRALYPKTESGTRLLLGVRYALLRQDFLEWGDRRRSFPERGSRILVTLGGGDVREAILKVIGALTLVETGTLEVVVMTGSADPREFARDSSLKRIRLPAIRFENDTRRMPERMAWADLAISAGGSTCWELCFMGAPFICGILAENQRPIAEALAREKIALNVGCYRETSILVLGQALRELIGSASLRRKMSERGQKLVDGRGAERVLRSLGRSRHAASQGVRR